MANTQSATQSTTNSGGSSQSSGVVGWRDANLSVGGLDMSGLFSDSSKTSATSGNIEVGDRILGGSKSSFKFGLVKILALVAGVAIVVKIWKGSKK